MEMKGKIAFIKWGSFSHTNDNVLTQLLKQFQDYHIDVFDIPTDLVNTIDFIGALFCIKEYGAKVLFSKNEMIKRINRTPYSFNRVKKVIEKKLTNGGYTFTFFKPSLFSI